MFAPETRILIVDDMGAMRKMVAIMCKELGFKDLSDAADGNLAWDVLQKASPPIELIISDWNMPNCTGLELLQRVRADQRFSILPFLMVTAEAQGPQVTAAIMAGVDSYIVKPFALVSLQTKLEAIHKKRMS